MSDRADYAAGDDVFVCTMGQLLGPPLLPGNKITILQNGDEIFHTTLVIGNRDKETDTVSVRTHGRGNPGPKLRDEVLADILPSIKDRRA